MEQELQQMLSSLPENMQEKIASLSPEKQEEVLSKMISPNKVPVEVERNETISTSSSNPIKTTRGTYLKKISENPISGKTKWEAPKDNPSHEEDGIQLHLEDGDVVFSDKFKIPKNVPFKILGKDFSGKSFKKAADFIAKKEEKLKKEFKDYSDNEIADDIMGTSVQMMLGKFAMEEDKLADLQESLLERKEEKEIDEKLSPISSRYGKNIADSGLIARQDDVVKNMSQLHGLSPQQIVNRLVDRNAGKVKNTPALKNLEGNATADFKELLASKESGGYENPYIAISGVPESIAREKTFDELKDQRASTATGKYQFTEQWLGDIKKVTGVSSMEEFRKNPAAQESFFDWYDEKVLTPTAIKLMQKYRLPGTIDQWKAQVHLEGESNLTKKIKYGMLNTSTMADKGFKNPSPQEYAKGFRYGGNIAQFGLTPKVNAPKDLSMQADPWGALPGTIQGSEQEQMNLFQLLMEQFKKNPSVNSPKDMSSTGNPWGSLPSSNYDWNSNMAKQKGLLDAVFGSEPSININVGEATGLSGLADAQKALMEFIMKTGKPPVVPKAPVAPAAQQKKTGTPGVPAAKVEKPVDQTEQLIGPLSGIIEQNVRAGRTGETDTSRAEGNHTYPEEKASFMDKVGYGLDKAIPIMGALAKLMEKTRPANLQQMEYLNPYEDLDTSVDVQDQQNQIERQLLAARSSARGNPSIYNARMAQLASNAKNAMVTVLSQKYNQEKQLENNKELGIMNYLNAWKEKNMQLQKVAETENLTAQEVERQQDNMALDYMANLYLRDRENQEKLKLGLMNSQYDWDPVRQELVLNPKKREENFLYQRMLSKNGAGTGMAADDVKVIGDDIYYKNKQGHWTFLKKKESGRYGGKIKIT